MKKTVISMFIFLSCMTINGIFAGDDAVTVTPKQDIATVADGVKVKVFPGVKSVTYDDNGWLNYYVQLPKGAGVSEKNALAAQMADFAEKNYLKSVKFTQQKNKWATLYETAQKEGKFVYIYTVTIPEKNGAIDVDRIKKNGLGFNKVPDYQGKYKDLSKK
jgi:hypothetical protein